MLKLCGISLEESIMPENINHLIEKRLDILPEYVREFIEYRGRKNSENTLLTYCMDYEGFFGWLVSEGTCHGEMKDVALKQLEVLKTHDIVRYENFLHRFKGNSKDTVARKLNALKSLFHYLSQIAEDDDFYPYIKRNVMAKIEVLREKRSETEISEQIANRILVDEEIPDFREFIAHNYGQTIKDNKRNFNAYLHNRERDLAIISLILGSGLRVSEIVQIDVDKIDWNKQYVIVKRKGDKLDKVVFSDTALLDLYEYKKIREERYKPESNEKAFFLSSTTKTGKANRFSKSSAQKMVNKYAAAFGKGDLSIHKLRHTFATQHYKNNNDIASLKRQLGHSNINTTMIYTHVFDNTLIKAVNKADK